VGENQPLYSSLIGSLKYMYLMCLGELNADGDFFAMGTKSQELILWILFICATFLMIITMMNMLIAIMGETFANNSEVADENRLREHLQFIVDHWFIDPFSERGKHRINYLMTAFLNEEDEEDVEILKDL